MESGKQVAIHENPYQTNEYKQLVGVVSELTSCCVHTSAAFFLRLLVASLRKTLAL
jgi:hypothetical protein